jgi:hypothetical protein
MTFARSILSGNMTDQQAAEAAGLNPSTAAYTKAKPRVRAYMLEHRALMQQQLVEQETESVGRFHLGRERVLDRLWELATMGPEISRGSITGQVKAMSMIVAIEGLIPDRRAGSTQKEPAPPPTKPQIYESEWLRKQKEKYAGQPNPAHDQEDQKEAELPLPEAEPSPVSASDLPPDPGPIFDPGGFASDTQSPPYAAFAPDTRVPFSIKKNLFSRRRL